MFDDLYSRMIGRFDYKKLMIIPVALAIILTVIIATKGIPLGLDFAGGSWIEVEHTKSLSEQEFNSLRNDLEAEGLENLEVYKSSNIGSEKKKIIISTTTVVEQEKIIQLLSEYLGEIREEDVATVELDQDPGVTVEEELENKITDADITYEKENQTLTIRAIEINSEELKRALDLYLDVNTQLEIKNKNIRIQSVGKTLGDTFWKQGQNAVLFAYALIIAVVLFVFRDFVPSIAIIAAATFDAIFALGGMSILGLLLEPAALVSLLMLIGYSVDSDILLTTRVMKTKKGNVDERIDSAMKTGLTMTGTTMGAMIVILIVTTLLMDIPALPNIAAVLILGLIADIINTWMLNAGILKWYVEEQDSKLEILKKLGLKKGSR